MKVLVVDASIVAAALFDEEHGGRARALLTGKSRLHAPDFIAIEIANVIWKRRQRREIDTDEALELLADADRLPLLRTPAAGLARPALELAMEVNRTVYDCLYLALALREDAVMVTADQKLVNALAYSPIKRQIAWIGNYRQGG